jgi:putative transposase
MDSIKINKSFKYRLYPTKEQEVLIAKHFGCNRLVWNHFLSERQNYYLTNKEAIEEKRIKGSLNYYDNAKSLTSLKNDLEFLREVNSQSLQATLKDLEGAYRNFFRKTHKFPHYKSRKNPKQSFKIPQNFRIEDKKVFLPKFQKGIPIILHRPIEGRIISATLSKSSGGKYYISFCCEVDRLEKKQIDCIIGVDLGIKDFAITSDGERYSNGNFYRKTEKKLKFIQRKYSKHKGLKTKKQLGKLHEKVSNQRKDFLHKLSFKMVNENQVIVLEDLNVKGMLKNHKLAKSISDVGWGYFYQFLNYKSGWYGREIIKIDRFFPSSKTCSICGYVKDDLTLKDRTWKCSKCNGEIDRDLNAAINILKQGLNKCGRNYRIKQCELPTIVGALTTEAHGFSRG